MKAIGIVAEFNPFHLGHAYFIKQAKQETGADYALVMMSGDFVQRGAPACMDKYTRTTSALLGGADLVLELPVVYATASAEFFARRAVCQLAETGVVDTICFGTKYPDFPFEFVAEKVLSPSKEFEDLIHSDISSGVPYPKARANAIKQICNLECEFKITDEMLEDPNTILGIEYTAAAIRCQMRIHPILRSGNDYHDISMEGEFLSASAIRNALEEDKDFSKGLSKEDSLAIAKYKSQKKLLCADDFSDLLYQMLLQHEATGYEDFLDCDIALSNRIQKHLRDYQSFTQFASLIKTKNYSYARISRMLLHILLDIKSIPDHADYYRILGFRSDATDLLSEIKQKSRIPLVAKMANAFDFLSEEGKSLLKKDIYAAMLYEQIAYQSAEKYHEMTQSPIRIS